MASFSSNPFDGSADFSPIDYRAELNDQQYEAVVHAEGAALVLAGAGSGKTRTMTYRVAWLLEQGYRPGEILLLTFTNKAANEMLGRVYELTGVPSRQFWGGTFHSIGHRILRLHGADVGLGDNFTIMDQGDAESLLGDVIRIADAAFLKNKDNPKARVVAEMISYARNTLQRVTDVIAERYPWLHDRADVFEDFAKRYAETKAKQNVCDYDDLLEKWLWLMRNNREVAEMYQHRFRQVLVDEYQDTNKLQSEIVKAMSAHHKNVMIVGDNWQCIYTWRGAEFSNMTDFTEAFPNRKIFKIETNYRSSPQILQLANEMMGNHPHIDGYPLELQAHNGKGPLPYLVPVIDTRQQADFVLRRIEGLQEEGYRLKEICVLYRAHFHAMDLQMELSRRGVRYTITSGVRFFEQAHIRDFVAQLRLVSNPGDSAAFVRLVSLLPKVGMITAQRLHALAQKIAERDNRSLLQSLTSDTVLAKVPKDAVDDWKDMGYTLQDMEEAMGGPAKSPLAPVNPNDPHAKKDAQRDLFAEVKAEEKQRANAKMPEEIVKIGIDGWYGDYLRTIYDNWQSRRDDLDSLVGFAGRFDSMPELLAQLVLLNSETSDRKIDPEEDSLRLTTIHQAKGLEFPIVFVLGLADELFPIKRAIDSGDTDEERRLFYVAITRAMKELYLIYPRVTATGGPPRLLEPSRFLRDVDQSRYEMLHMRG